MGSARISSVRFDDLLCLYANVFWYFWPRDRLCTHGSKRGRKKEAVESCGNRQTRHWLSAWNRAGLRRHPFLTELTFGNQPANGGNYTTPTRCRLQAAASSSSSLLRTWIQSRSPKPSIVGSITLPLLLLGRAVIARCRRREGFDPFVGAKRSARPVGRGLTAAYATSRQSSWAGTPFPENRVGRRAAYYYYYSIWQSMYKESSRHSWQHTRFPFSTC